MKKYILLLIIVTALMLFKVYIANELYYTSRNIQKLSIRLNALKEERSILKLNIEKLKYKNTIIDPLYEYKPKPPKPTPKEVITPKDTKELFENLDITKEIY